jgi:predicted RNase H-like HicB family nuclease
MNICYKFSLDFIIRQRKYHTSQPFFDIIDNVPIPREDVMGKRYNIEYTVQIWKEGKQYIAHAMPLDVMSCGPTPDDARKNLDEAVHLFLVTATGMRIADFRLRERSIERKKDNSYLLLRNFYSLILETIVYAFDTSY